MKITLRTVFFVCFFILGKGMAFESRFQSGLPKAIALDSAQFRLTEFEAAEKVIEEEFQDLENLEWKLSKRQEDNTHVHLTYDLFSQGYPVFFQHLKIHYNKEGFVDYLTSTLQRSVTIPLLPRSTSWDEVEKEASARLFGRSYFSGKSKGTLGVWLNKDQDKAEWAFFVEASPNDSELTKRGVMAVENLQVLEEKRVLRFWHEPESERASVSLKVYTPFPTGASSGASTVSTSTDESGKLKNEYVYVRYDTPDVTPNQGPFFDVGATSGISLLTAHDNNYAYDCSDYQGSCLNQKTDAGNVFYQLTEFRNRLEAIANILGTSLQFSYDPLPVFLNYTEKKLQDCPGTGSLSATTQLNNAAYYASLCDQAGTIDHCLVFLRYGDTFDSSFPCSGLKVDPGGSLAREALIIAHEYQHYVTDMITGIEFGGSSEIRVGDVIHEGYSDYFGASYVTKQSNQTHNVIGEYAFKTGYQAYKRDLSVKKVFSQTEVYSSEHGPGWVWASALWELRSLLGVEAVDQIAFKSLYYLSTTPGFIDSVQALVEADKSLFGGVNGSTIKRIFFDERKFIGSLTGVFQDEDKNILKVGFQGCANVNPNANTQDSKFPTLAILLIWLVSTLWSGRRFLWNRK